jgi:hypothetical protein
MNNSFLAGKPAQGHSTVDEIQFGVYIPTVCQEYLQSVPKAVQDDERFQLAPLLAYPMFDSDLHHLEKKTHQGSDKCLE